MHNLSELNRNVIADAREIISKLYDADDRQLHLLNGELAKLQELLLFLKVANEYANSELQNTAVFVESEHVDSEPQSAIDEFEEIEDTAEILTLEEFDGNADLSVETDETAELSLMEVPLAEHTEEDLVSEKETESESEFPADISEEPEIIPLQPEPEIAVENSVTEPELLEEEERLPVEEEEILSETETEEVNTSRGQIIDFDAQPFEHSSANDEGAKKAEGKLKLASIKGLKKIQSLFDEDPLESAKTADSEPEPVKGDLQKRNVPTDYLEAIVHPEFKLDLNDRIAFTKILFDGSQTELNHTIKELNSFKTLDEAKEYLSDQYYARKWNKSHEYALRLWRLVESRFH